MITSASDIKKGVVLVLGKERVKVIGARGRTTILVRAADGWPISSRSVPRGICIGTIMRDWSIELDKEGKPCTT